MARTTRFRAASIRAWIEQNALDEQATALHEVSVKRISQAFPDDDVWGIAIAIHTLRDEIGYEYSYALLSPDMTMGTARYESIGDISDDDVTASYDIAVLLRRK